MATLLLARGFTALTTRDSGQLGQTDSTQLDYAASHDLLFLTHNRVDFEALHRKYLASNQKHSGIVIASRRHPHVIVVNLLRLLNGMTADELRGQLLYV